MVLQSPLLSWLLSTAVGMMLCVLCVLCCVPLLLADDRIDCGQLAPSAQPEVAAATGSTSSTPIVIDYAVFYTPEARQTQGGTEEIEARITEAFADANELFTQSGLTITHRVVRVEELPLNNSSETLPEIGSELAAGFDFQSALNESEADSSVIIVNFQRPGGFANIPGSRSQARLGGAISLGLPNVSGNVLAHEIGHTLGSGHDYASAVVQSFDLPPNYGYGNHFLGATTGECYRTIMSALTSCRISGFENVQTIQSNRFSSPNLLFDGTPTGQAEIADNVRLFEEYAPLVGSARGAIQLPGDDPSDGLDTLTLAIKTKGTRTFARGRCLADDSSALEGDSILINRINRRSQAEVQVATTQCNQAGRYNARLKRKGSYKAKNSRTGTESRTVRLR